MFAILSRIRINKLTERQYLDRQIPALPPIGYPDADPSWVDHNQCQGCSSYAYRYGGDVGCEWSKFKFGHTNGYRYHYNAGWNDLCTATVNRAVIHAAGRIEQPSPYIRVK